MAVYSTMERKNRPRGDRRSLEMTRHLESTFKSSIRTTCYPRSQIDIYVEVLEADGSNLAVCINAATLALVDAGIAMIDLVCACTAAMLAPDCDEPSAPVIDVSAVERLQTVATASYHPNLEKVQHYELLGRAHVDTVNELIDAALKGCRDMHSILEVAIRERQQQLASTLQPTG